jgi:hypothetical protein
MQCSCTVLSSVVLQYFSTLSHIRRDFRKKVIEYKKCSLPLWPGTFSKTIQRFIAMYMGLRVKYPLFFSYFNEIWIFSTDFRKAFKYQISWTSVQWEPSCSMRSNGQTWRSQKSLFAILQTHLIYRKLIRIANFPSQTWNGNLPNTVYVRTPKAACLVSVLKKRIQSFNWSVTFLPFTDTESSLLRPQYTTTAL